ncbi:IMP cyclohydrolase /phosphoribosylaminoimidazolecarboxamide formyltransferase [Nitrosomonas marina]|uniref:Bifunctional purine biosynthesis protein PurH n=1 Tax=Nitrosomonas marina TaxID=917 RepID=A0A1I0G454_9PROT|nr:bifunctional phosphoribosylaminoimidazolecarboxamide formyltransferase/IMP cyclohydrolase [Nitrosomonas marina]SET64676.1 IMP cyclohydrolase /phosphoribosylaminoimidazolecarboxamide formyltransferase [Nitrosomonas marina]
MSIKQALISVSDKTGVTELARTLHQSGITIISTGGTATLMQENGIPVTEVSEYTEFPEMLDGRVKTLHPKIHAGILSRRDSPDHISSMEQTGFADIELVIVNLYPFTQTIAKPDCTLDHAIENIDIGGPAMIRAAAKNYKKVTVITDPEDYSALLNELAANNGAVSAISRFKFAQKAFSHTAAYDSAISNYLTATDDDGNRNDFPGTLNLNFNRMQFMRYGENPHQKAAFYRDLQPVPGGLASYHQLQGKALSYNNIADTDAAWECVKSFEDPACVIIKHANPCGVAVADDILTAYQRAFSTDPTSAFGGIIAFNRPLDTETTTSILKQFVEVIIAPDVTSDARTLLAQKNNIRVLTLPLDHASHQYDLKRIGGGLLVQSPDNYQLPRDALKVVTRRMPTEQQMNDLLFAWRVAKYVKSNAIVYCSNNQTLGIGAGQMSRIDSAKIASIKARQAGLDLSGSVVASDAFFPFRDGLDIVVEAGAHAVIQPGGSIRDEEVIAAADEQDIAMVFTSVRHFRH